MPDFGQCSEPLCTEISVRLFDCAHHCMKLVCLEHLIEHDRMIEHNQDYFNNLQTEVKQLWTTYSLLVDETKLCLEFEQRLKKHQQLIRDISNLFENNSINIEHYRLMIDKLKQNIEQEKQYSIDSFPHIEQVKCEPNDEISFTSEVDSMDVSLATRIERLNNNIGQQKRRSISNDSSIINEYDNNTSDNNETIHKQKTDGLTIRKLCSECPLWFDGAYGLTEESHGMYICPRKVYRKVYRHLVQFHKLTISNAEKICQAIKAKKDPLKENLFELNEIIIDQINQFQCPFSIYNDESTRIEDSSERQCRTIKPQLPPTLRYHLVRDHQMSIVKANKIVYNLKTNSKDVIKN